jgi:hypothetical protein
MTLVYAATAWGNNGKMIADVARLGYIKPTDRVLDPTYENGIWWKHFRPENLVTYYREEDGSDYRLLPEEDESFDVIAYDPPYVCPGGLKTSTIKEFHERFGQDEGGIEPGEREFSSPAELQDLMNDGLTEMCRLVRRGGIILMKAKNYVSSGKVWWGVDKSLAHANNLGLVKIDELLFLAKGPQDENRTRQDGTPSTQQHARRNHSNLLVLQKPRSWRPPYQEDVLA